MSGSRKLRILMIINQFSRGGAERQLLRLVSSLRATHEFKVIALQSGGDFAAAFEEAGIVIEQLGMASGLKNLKNILGYGTLLRRAVGFRPDVIHGWLFEGNAAAVLIGRLIQVPVIASKRGSNVSFSKHRKSFENVVYRGSDHVCTNSQLLEREILESGLAKDKITVIPNGIALEEVPRGAPAASGNGSPLFPEKIVIGSIGRFVFEKRYEDLLEAAKILLRVHDNIHFLWVGGRGELEIFKLAVEDSGLSDKISFTGEVVSVREWLEQMDIFVLSSSQEGMPNVVMEAMAYGKAVVATNVGGVPELVDQGKTGFLVSAREPASLAKSIEVLILDEEKRAAFGRAGREKIEEFSVTKLAERMSKVYLSLANQ
jgi:L-malate glycosyltransferase